MFGRFMSLFKQDMTVAFRSYFQYVILILAVIMILVINFAIPEKVKLTPNEVFYDSSEGKVLESYLLQQGVDKSRFFTSREALEQEITDNDQAIGIMMEGTLARAKFTIIHQGTESTEILNVLDASIEGTLEIIRGTVRKTNHRVEYLRPKAEPIPFNKSMIPVMIVLDAVMLGFLLIAVMVFQEKEEGSVRAYRVGPGGPLEYILSKAAVNVLLALVYSLLVVAFTAGFKVHFISLVVLLSLASLLMTLVGLSVSVFFRNIQEFLFIGVLVLAVAGIPMVSYLNPSFAPSFITWLPSYPVLFGLREILFPTGKTAFVSTLNWMLLAECGVFLVICFWAVKRKLMKEGN